MPALALRLGQDRFPFAGAHRDDALGLGDVMAAFAGIDGAVRRLGVDQQIFTMMHKERAAFRAKAMPVSLIGLSKRSVDAAMANRLGRIEIVNSGIDFRRRDFENLVILDAAVRREAAKEQFFRI